MSSILPIPILVNENNEPEKPFYFTTKLTHITLYASIGKPTKPYKLLNLQDLRYNKEVDHLNHTRIP